MPRLELNPAGDGPVIQGFSGTGFRIDGAVFASGALLSPTGVEPWAPPPIEALDVAALDALVVRDPAPEFLLLGTGATLRRPSPGFVAAVESRGLGVEAMDSRAAARAWSVLRGEGREVVAALYPLDR